MSKGKFLRSPKGEPAPSIKDEPGADQRFSNILKRALHTPPKRKQAAAAKPKKR